jgi:hypothetical protein
MTTRSVQSWHSRYHGPAKQETAIPSGSATCNSREVFRLDSASIKVPFCALKHSQRDHATEFTNVEKVERQFSRGGAALFQAQQK